MTLFDECIEVLGEHVHILDDAKGQQVVDGMESSFPFMQWQGRIDWGKVEHHAEVEDTVDDVVTFLTKTLGEYSNEIYIIWDEATQPVIKTHLEKVFEFIDYVTCVSFDTWLYSPSSGYIIEFYHEGEVMIGLK